MSTRLGRPTVAIVLSEEERETLERWARRPSTAQALALRSRIVLAAAAGQANTEIAAALGCHPVTAGKWRRRFAQRRLDGLSDEPRPGAPRTISDAQVEAVIVKTLEQQPRHATHWSTRSMAAELGMSQTAISRIWRAFGLKPHLVEQFKLSPDPQFIDKVRDVAGLYLNPPDAAVVLCVDEKTQIQALDWAPPAGFARHAFDVPGYVGETPFWGRFWEVPCLEPAQREILTRARDQIEGILGDYGYEAGTYSLIHADLHPHNILVGEAGALHVIDFDDSGFGWHQYELAVALFSYQTEPWFDAISEALLAGYRSVRGFDERAVELLPLFLLIRALVMIGWIWDRPELGYHERLVRVIEEACERAEAFPF